MAEDLVTRLRKFWGDVTNRDILEAAEEIERLNAENARLREALQMMMDDTPGWYDLARAALAEKEEK